MKRLVKKYIIFGQKLLMIELGQQSDKKRTKHMKEKYNKNFEHLPENKWRNG